MEAHLQLGAIMFSLLTIEMKYTSMDYLAPGNFKRGNAYLLSMYEPLSSRLQKLLQKFINEYEEECRDILHVRAETTTPNDFMNSQRTAEFNRRSSSVPPHPIMTSVDAQGKYSESGASASIYHPSAHPTNDLFMHNEFGNLDHGVSVITDAQRQMENEGEVDILVSELETVKSFVGFILSFIEVRKAMVVLYRLIAVTGPVLQTPSLNIMLDYCNTILDSVTPDPLYDVLLGHVRFEVDLVRELLAWDTCISQYSFAKSVVFMHKIKRLLSEWKADIPPPSITSATVKTRRSAGSRSIYESISEAIGGSGQRDEKSMILSSSGESKGLFYTAFTRSTKMVQNLFWGNASGSNSGIDDLDPNSSRMRSVLLWIELWYNDLTIRTTTYFQQLLVPHRSLFTGEDESLAVDDIWSRPGLSPSTTGKQSFNEMVNSFLQNNDAYYVALLFESSNELPYIPDGVSISGSQIKIPDSGVQSCRLLFCMRNHQLLASRGLVLKNSLAEDIHTFKKDRTTANGMAVDRQISDIEWFRQNCLADLVSAIQKDQDNLDRELLYCNPLLKTLGNDTNKLLKELDDSVACILDERVQGTKEDTPSSIDISLADGRGPNGSLMELPTLRAGSKGNSPDSVATTGNGGEEYQPYHLNISNLYSSYMLKPHLRNNEAASGSQSHHVSRAFVGRSSSHSLWKQDARTRHKTQSSLSALQHASFGELAEQSPSANRSPAEYATAGRKAGHEADDQHLRHRRSAELGSLAPVKDARHNVDEGAAASPFYRSKATSLRPRPSIQTLFVPPASSRSSLAQVHNADSLDAKAADNESLLKRMRSGDRLKELNSGSRNFGDELGSARNSVYDNNNRRGSIHSLSFVRTPTRTSFGPKPGSTTSAAIAPQISAPADTAAVAEASGGFSKRIGHPAMSPKSPIFSETSAVNNAGETSSVARNRSELLVPPPTPHQQHQQHQHQQQQQQQQQHHQEPHGKYLKSPQHTLETSASTSTMTISSSNRAEKHTYLYSRVHLPNISLVTIMLDSEKSTARRYEAEKQWLEIVNVIRGTPVFEHMTTLPT
ncbi:hypothetical protein GGI12_003373 [Dipsacomyces acuminosporus]|nr:hypothetical protein GGI12_003373 [Dipsacomyces acuminosporus]